MVSCSVGITTHLVLRLRVNCCPSLALVQLCFKRLVPGDVWQLLFLLKCHFLAVPPMLHPISGKQVLPHSLGAFHWFMVKCTSCTVRGEDRDERMDVLGVFALSLEVGEWTIEVTSVIIVLCGRREEGFLVKCTS